MFKWNVPAILEQGLVAAILLPGARNVAFLLEDVIEQQILVVASEKDAVDLGGEQAQELNRARGVFPAVDVVSQEDQSIFVGKVQLAHQMHQERDFAMDIANNN